MIQLKHYSIAPSGIVATGLGVRGSIMGWSRALRPLGMEGSPRLEFVLIRGIRVNQSSPESQKLDTNFTNLRELSTIPLVHSCWNKKLSPPSYLREREGQIALIILVIL